MNINTRDMAFVNFNGQEMQFVKFNGVTVYESWKDLTANGVPPLVLFKCKGVDLVDYKIFGNSVQDRILPREYQQLDYIVSNKQQHIDTGYIPNQNTKVYAKFQLTSIGANYPFGVRASSQSRICYIAGGASNWTFRFGATSNISYGTADTELHEITMSLEGTYFDDVFFEQVDTSNFTCPGNLYLFALNNNGSTSRGATKMYEFKIWDSGELIKHYIPCYRKTDNVAGMYDLINNEFLSGEQETSFVLGNTVTPIPTPELPVIIDSVGEKTKNLFDEQWETGFISVSTGANSSSSTSIRTKNYIKLQPNTTYYVTINSSNIYPVTYKKDKSFSRYIGLKAKSFSLTTNEDEYYLRLALYNRTDIPKETQVELGTGTEYEPHGYKIPVRVSNDLFKTVKLEQGSIADATGVLSDSDARVRTNLFTLEKGIYTISMNWNINKCMVKGLHFYDYESENWIKYVGGGTAKKTFELTEKTKVRIVFNKSASAGSTITPEEVLTSEIFMVQGDETTTVIETTTNIYLKEPLRMYEECVDYIDFKKQVVVRAIKELTITGSENWKYSGTQGDEKVYYYFTIGGNRYVISHKGFNTHYSRIYIASSNTDVGYNAIRSSAGDCRILIRPENVENYTSVGEFTNMLKSFYNNGNPMIATYALTTPEDEPIELPNIPTIKGATVIEVDTTIQPSNLEVVYKGKE